MVSTLSLPWGFTYVDWGSSIDDRHFTCGYCVFLGGNIITWSSRKQKGVSKSSIKSKYRSLSQATTELIWLHVLFKELGITLQYQSVIWCDKTGANSLSSNIVFHARKKHIEVDIHYVRRKIALKLLDHIIQTIYT